MKREFLLKFVVIAENAEQAREAVIERLNAGGAEDELADSGEDFTIAAAFPEEKL